MLAVVLNYNGLDDTLACLESLRVQSCAGLSVLVIDNGGRTDEARAYVDGHGRSSRCRRRQAREQTDPQQRQGQLVRQQLVIHIDRGEGDQEPGEYERRGGGPAWAGRRRRKRSSRPSAKAG